MIPGYLLAGIGISFLRSCITLNYESKSYSYANDYTDALKSLDEFSTWSQLIVVIMCVPLFFISDKVDKSLEEQAKGDEKEEALLAQKQNENQP